MSFFRNTAYLLSRVINITKFYTINPYSKVDIQKIHSSSGSTVFSSICINSAKVSQIKYVLSSSEDCLKK